MSGDWVAFWDGPHAIYVNARHRDVHYRLLANEIAALVPSPAAHVLDYGCGEALHAGDVAATCGKLVLCDGAPRVRASLAARFAADPKLRIVAPEELEHWPGGDLDLIVLHSVAQYLDAADTAKLLALFRRLLKRSGTLVVSDVIPPHVPAATDALALLRFAAANGFLLAALGGLTRTVLSDYMRLRSRLGLMRYSEAAMLQRLHAAGFAAKRMPKNIGHNQARMAFIAAPRDGEAQPA